MISKKKSLEVQKYVSKYGIEKTKIDLNLTESSVKRYLRFEPETDIPLAKDLLKLKDLYSAEEIKALVLGGRPGTGGTTVPHISVCGDTVRLGVVSDTHIGSKYTSDYHLGLVQHIFKEEGITIGVHAGDITEGMSHRAGHVYELSHIGYNKQKAAAIDFFKGFHRDIKWNVIDGNHDRWYAIGQNAGADIVGDIATECPKGMITKIGSDTGYFNINGVVVQLWHGGDGAAYARSYRIQKIVESITGGRKPNLLITGHDHKEIFLTERNIHVLGAGCIQQQTDYMRGKRLSAHVGLWIVEMTVNDGRIVRFKPEWISFYA